MKHNTPIHRCRTYFLVGGLVLLLAGCTPKPKPGTRTPQPPEDAPRSVVLRRVNANAQAMDFLLRAGSIRVDGEYFREGKLEPFDATGTMLFRRPRDLYLKLDKPMVGEVEIGSNAREWWVWNKIENRYYWSRHDDVIELDSPVDMPIRPDYLAGVLGLSVLPDQGEGPVGPLFWVAPDRYELNYVEQNAAGHWYYTRAVDIDRYPPYLIREMVFFRPDGHPEVKAWLSDYKPVRETNAEVLAPTTIEIKWLSNSSSIRMNIGDLKRFNNNMADRLIEQSPLQRGQVGSSEAIRIGRPNLKALPTTTPDLGAAN